MKPCNQLRVLVTGATGGIGSALSHRLAQDGVLLLLHGRSEQKLRKLAQKLGAETVQADITTQQGREKVLAVSKTFQVNTLINNAGINQFGQFVEADIEQIMAINVVATMKLVQAFLPFFEAQAWSTILNVGSTFGSIGFPGYVSYCASKHALKGFTEALRRELSMSSTSVLYVSPRATATAMNHERVDELNEKLSVTVDSPEAVAAQIVEVLYTDRPTSQLGWPEKLQVKLNAVFPTLVDKSIASQLATIKAYF